MVHSSVLKNGGLGSISEWFQLNTEGVKDTPPTTVPTEGKHSHEVATRDDHEQTSVATSHRVDDDTTINRTSTSEEPEELTHLDWRMNAKKSLSDWTIVITTPSRITKYYHVHRSIIMLPCKYFCKLFKKYRRLPDGRSDFNLDDKAANAFPEFLDYIYHLNNEADLITRDNVVPLYYLSRIFMVDRLRWETRQFWETDMSIVTIANYYRLAIVFEEEPLLDRVLKACLDDPSILAGLECEADILSVANPRLLLHLVKNAGSDKENSEHLSRLVAKFCALHPDQVDVNTFTALTVPLSAISVEVACKLLIQENGKFKGPKESLTSLQKCCISALAKHWSKLDVKTAEFQKMLSTQSPLFLAELFQKTIMAVQGLSTDDEVEPSQGVDEVFCSQVTESKEADES